MRIPEHFCTGYIMTKLANESFDPYAAIIDYKIKDNTKSTRDKEYLKLRKKDWK